MSTLMDSDNVVLPFGKQLAANGKYARYGQDVLQQHSKNFLSYGV